MLDDARLALVWDRIDGFGLRHFSFYPRSLKVWFVQQATIEKKIHQLFPTNFAQRNTNANTSEKLVTKTSAKMRQNTEATNFASVIQ
jgi:hypothetical protein